MTTSATDHGSNDTSIEGEERPLGPDLTDFADAAEAIPVSDDGDDGDDSEGGAVAVELAELKDKYLRLLADFENHKKRTLKERSEMLKYQGERVFIDLLEVVDNFDRAMAFIDSDPEQVKVGVKLIHKALHDLLTKWEVRGETAIGTLFDPYRHNAISKVPSDTVPAGQVVDEVKKCFVYKDKILRTGEVVVAVAPSE